MRQLFFRLKSDQYRNLSNNLAFLALGIPLGIIIIGRFITTGKDVLFSVLVHIAYVLMFSLGGVIGLLAVIRKEFHQIVTIRGRTAQFFGGLLFIMATLIVLYGIVHLILTIW